MSAFGLDARPEYVEVTSFTKGIGFSVQRAYPDKSKFKPPPPPPTKRKGEPDSYAMIGIVYEPSRSSANRSQVVPVSAKVSVFSRYVSKHWDYNFDDDNCPTEESVIASKKTPKPVELSAFDEYAYDHEQNSFIDVDGNPIDGMSIIDGLYDSHIATVDKFKGMVFRWKLASRNRAGSTCEAIRERFKWLLEKKIAYANGQHIELDGYSEEKRVLCEVYARIGALKGSQPDKLASDILKLLLAEQVLGGKWSKYLVFADSKAAGKCTGKSWLAHVCSLNDIGVEVVTLDDTTRDQILKAQERQVMVNKE